MTATTAKPALSATGGSFLLEDATPESIFYNLAGNLVAGWQLARALLVAETLSASGEDKAFMDAKVTTARFYAEHILARAPGIRDSIVEGADSVTALALEAF